MHLENTTELISFGTKAKSLEIMYLDSKCR